MSHRQCNLSVQGVYSVHVLPNEEQPVLGDGPMYTQLLGLTTIHDHDCLHVRTYRDRSSVQNQRLGAQHAVHSAMLLTMPQLGAPFSLEQRP